MKISKILRVQTKLLKREFKNFKRKKDKIITEEFSDILKDSINKDNNLYEQFSGKIPENIAEKNLF